MKKIIYIMMILALMAGVSYGQSKSGGRGTIVKDVSYFDADGNLIVPILYADSLEVGSGDLSIASNLTVTGTSTLGSLAGYLFGTAGVVSATLDGSSFTNVPADDEVFGSADITIGTIAAAQRITTNSIAMLDTAGTAKADYALIRAWMSAAAYGAASTNNIEGLVLTGTEVEEVVANGDYWQVTVSNGTATATITGSAAGTNYLNVSVGANVSSEAIVLTD